MKRRLIRDLILTGLILLAQVKVLLVLNEEKKRSEDEDISTDGNSRGGGNTEE